MELQILKSYIEKVTSLSQDYTFIAERKYTTDVIQMVMDYSIKQK